MDRTWICGSRKGGQAGQEERLEHEQWELTSFVDGIVRRHLFGVKQVLRECLGAKIQVLVLAPPAA